MIGMLPKSLLVDGVYYPIESDFRIVLLIMQLYNDRTISLYNAHMTMLRILFTTTPEGETEPVTNIPPDINEAINKAMWFLNIGEDITNEDNSKDDKKILDYKKDEQYLFSAVNAVYTKDVRSEDYLHWWTFYGLCQAIDGESMISVIMSLRRKLANHEKLEDHEMKFYKENQNLININGTSSGHDYDEMMRILRSE